ncbi:MAG: hypothetical protein R3240_03620 [Gammaproteobacteria bacterium]|nr:hypothetical protein [Gammaproteobacteria bacterium]
MSNINSNWALACHFDFGGQGTLGVLKPGTDAFLNLTADNASGQEHAPWFLGITADDKVIMLDQVSKEITLTDKMPRDAYPAYCYTDKSSGRVWFMNDGDKNTGNDTLNCGNNGASVTIVAPANNGSAPIHVATLCVGRGHHVPTFVGPDSTNPERKKLAFLSNLLDGTINVINNDDTDQENFLKIIHTIDLVETEKEKDGTTAWPNNAFPHGKQYSEVTGKIYSLNNGYGTIAVINPDTFEIESRINLKGASNLLLSPCGKYIIGKGADRKSDAEHVVGKISIVDVQSQEVLSINDVPDFYPSVYRFSPDKSKLFVTSAATGKDVQKDNLKINTLYVYDASKLPELSLIKVMEVGESDCGRRPLAFPADSGIKLMFNPNPSEGTVNIIDSEKLEIINTLELAGPGAKEFNFSLWEQAIYGA